MILTNPISFMGANQFCLKACDPADPDDDKYCEHILDRIGCAYNAPAAYKDGVFESCEGENQDFPGVYTSNGQVLTYKQPPESAGAITTMPYEPRIPASSNCVSFQSTALYTAGGVAAPSASASGSGSTTRPSGSSGSSSRSSAASSTATGQSGGAMGLTVVSSFSVITVGSVVFAALAGALAVL
jgi:hypothetical protein